ncbi:hypothetical protein ANTPLA_LOCUS7574 [Anthophora plagiata]
MNQGLTSSKKKARKTNKNLYQKVHHRSISPSIRFPKRARRVRISGRVVLKLARPFWLDGIIKIGDRECNGIPC